MFIEILDDLIQHREKIASLTHAVEAIKEPNFGKKDRDALLEELKKVRDENLEKFRMLAESTKS